VCAAIHEDTDGVTVIGSYDPCIGFKFAAFLAQSGKANALASSKLYVEVLHLSNGKRIKERAASIAWTDWAGKSKESCTRRATARPRGFAKRGPPFATGAKSREVTANETAGNVGRFA
jgi:hypothetical protein